MIIAIAEVNIYCHPMTNKTSTISMLRSTTIKLLMRIHFGFNNHSSNYIIRIVVTMDQLIEIFTEIYLLRNRSQNRNGHQVKTIWGHQRESEAINQRWTHNTMAYSRFLLSPLYIIACSFDFLLLAIVLSVLLRNTASDYFFGIFKLFSFTRYLKKENNKTPG